MSFPMLNTKYTTGWTLAAQDFVRTHWPNRRVWTLLISAFIVAILFFGSGIRPEINAHIPERLFKSRWSHFAYASYATNDDSLCNSLMLFESLDRLGSKPDRILLHPAGWNDSPRSNASMALMKKLKTHKVKLIPIEVQEFTDVDPTWSKGFTKLLAFNQTQYSRVLSLDSDATILQSLDDLFQLPPAPIAMPRAYWLEKDMNAQLILFTPSAQEYQRMENAYGNRPSGDTEMDMLNEIYREHCMVIPHRPWALLTGEFKPHKSHIKYMGTEEWDADAVLKEAKFVHFSDWPLPKPWQTIQPHQWEEVFPSCPEGQDCHDREVWLGLYRDFLKRRNDICGEAFMPVGSTIP